MKALLPALLLTVIASGPVLADDALGSHFAIRQGSNTCLDSKNVRGRTITDDSTIVFRMNDGTRWRNTLQKPCVGLRIADSFAMELTSRYICSNQQRIRVLRSDNICWLGDFTRVDN